MDQPSIAKAGALLQAMKTAAKKMERGLDKNDSDMVMEAKKEVIDLQKQIDAIL